MGMGLKWLSVLFQIFFFPVFIVARWDGGKVEVCVKRDQAGRKRRDEWDNEYDRGKVRIVEDHTGC